MKHYNNWRQWILTKQTDQMKNSTKSIFRKKELNITVIETVISDILKENKPLELNALYEFLEWLLVQEEEQWFTLYYELILANKPLYEFHSSKRESLYHYMFAMADQHPHSGAKNYGIGVHMILFKSFSI